MSVPSAPHATLLAGHLMLCCSCTAHVWEVGSPGRILCQLSCILQRQDHGTSLSVTTAHLTGVLLQLQKNAGLSHRSTRYYKPDASGLDRMATFAEVMNDELASDEFGAHRQWPCVHVHVM